MHTNAQEPTNCPSCGKPLPAGALAGLCPACLLAQGSETETADTKARVRFEPPKLAQISRLFPQLEVLELLGAGGMGAVYKARQPALDRLVALKVLPAGGGLGSAERFNREARALARLSHPNIVGVHEFGQVEGLHFFIMEFVDGANLRQLEKTARLSPREALQIIPQICDALQYAHDEGVVHRDIKPENVLVDRKGRVKIADFGLAKIADPDPAAARLTVEGQVMGTPHYMAPEQVERPLAVDHRADIYALGVVFYEMLTGDLPLGKFAPPSRKVQLDVRLDDIVLRALENDPERRYQQASEVKSQVENVTRSPDSSPVDKDTAQAGRPVGAGRETTVPQERCSGWLGVALHTRNGDRRQIRWGGALALFSLMLGLLTLLFAFVPALGLGTAGGLFGLAGWLSVTARVALALGLVALGLWLSELPGAGSELIPRKAVVLPSARKAWQRTGTGVVVALMALAWLYFQAHWLVPWFKGKLDNNAQVARINPATRTLAATLANGTTIELLGLARGDGAPNQWWRPDGTPIPQTVLDVQGPAEMLGNDRMRTKFAFKVTGSTWAMETATYEFEPSAGISAGGEVWQNGEQVTGGWPVVAAWAYVTNRATLRFGLRFDNWRNVAVFMPNKPSRTETSTVSGDPKWITKLNHYSDDGNNTLVTAVLNRETKQWRMRMVVVDTDGREHFYSRANSTPEEHTETWTYTFPNLTVDQIRQFNVQVQPVHWVEFRNVPLSPDGRLAKAASDADGRTAGESAAGFGPVLEADVPAPEQTRVAWFDLDTGVSVNLADHDTDGLMAEVLPTHTTKAESDAYQTRFKALKVRSGVDLSARLDGIPPGFGKMPAIAHKDMVVVAVDAASWETMTPEELLDALRGRPFSGQPAMEFSHEWTATYLFRTYEGGTGILQLTGFTNQPPGIRIRYRLLNPRPEEP